MKQFVALVIAMILALSFTVGALLASPHLSLGTVMLVIGLSWTVLFYLVLWLFNVY